MNNSERKRQRAKNELRLTKEKQKRMYLIGSLILLLACLFGRARGMKQSVISIFINNPSKGFSYIAIIVVSVLVFYLVSWLIIQRRR